MSRRVKTKLKTKFLTKSCTKPSQILVYLDSGIVPRGNLILYLQSPCSRTRFQRTKLTDPRYKWQTTLDIELLSSTEAVKTAVCFGL